MNCFNHRERPAIGLCKSCDKGLCEDCAVELTNGLACKGSCEDRVNLINRMIDSNTKVLNVARHQGKSSGIASLIMGIGFIIFAIWSYREMDSFLPYFLGLIGIVTLITGILRLSHKQQFPTT